MLEKLVKKTKGNHLLGVNGKQTCQIRQDAKDEHMDGWMDDQSYLITQWESNRDLLKLILE
jgi:hypothetical protein